MTLGGARQGATGQHADADHANAGFLGVVEQPFVILRRIVRRQFPGGGWIEHVVDELRAVEDAGIDHLMQRRRIADTRQPEETNLALLAQAFERRDYIAEHLPYAQRRSAALQGNRIMQVKDVDPVKAQSRQAAFERRRDGVGDAAEVGGRQPDFCAHCDARRLQSLQDATKVPFRFAVAVLHGGVEIIDAGFDRPRDGAFLVGRIAAHHKSADGAAAEAQHRQLHSGAPKVSQLHRTSFD